MSGRLHDLMARPPNERFPADYEAMFDDFIEWSGGARVSDAITVPPGVSNADYVIDSEEWQLIIELKQVAKYNPMKSADTYFSAMLQRGDLRTWEVTSSTEICVVPESLSTKQWNRFYDKAWPQIPSALTTANRQIAATKRLLPTHKRQMGCVLMVNTGDYNLPTDMLFRFVERKVKKEWRGGAFGSVDFVACKTIDMHHPHQHPLHARHIGRNRVDPAIEAAARWTFEKWISYACVELGLDETIIWTDGPDQSILNLGRKFQGKLRSANL